MRAPFAWHTLWAPAAALLAVALFVGVELRAQHVASERLAAVGGLVNRLRSASSQLQARHRRTVQRARAALQAPSQRDALLAWTSEHYTRQMARLLEAARQRIDDVPADHVRLQADLARLNGHLDSIGAHVGEVAGALDLLLGAAAVDDLDALAAGALELDRADADMLAALSRLDDLAVRAFLGQTRAVSRSPWPRVAPTLVLLGLLIPLAGAVALRPSRRLRQVLSRPAQPALTREEEQLRAALAEHRAEVERAQAELAARRLDAERAQAAARRWERELGLMRIYNENLVNSLRSAIVVTNLHHVVTAFNRVARERLGLDEAALEQPIDTLPLFGALAASHPKAKAELQRALGGELLRVEALPFRRAPDGQELLLDLTVAPYLDEGGAPRGLLWVSDDVTEGVRTKNQLLAAEHLAAVGRLSTQVAHEIRNPLSAIGLNTEMLQEELDAPQPLADARREEARALVRGIAAEVERLSQVTEGYLQLARLPRPECRDADLNELVSDLFGMLAPEMRLHRIEVDLHLDSPAPRAWADPGQLRQAMLNVVRNSQEAMPEGGRLRVRTASRGEQSTLEFTDTGVGIDPESARRAFEPFYTTKPEGTGLGLSLTEQILGDHHGEISIGPLAQGGTQVVLTLPAHPPA